ncbi:hypothetical protein GCM10027190_42760 [Spirosoma areae]
MVACRIHPPLATGENRNNNSPKQQTFVMYMGKLDSIDSIEALDSIDFQN